MIKYIINKKNIFLTFVTLLLISIVSFAEIANAYIYENIYNDLLNINKSLYIYILISIIVLIIYSTTSILQEYIQTKITLNISHNLRYKILENLVLKSKNNLSSTYIDDLLLILNKDIKNIEVFINEIIFNNISIILKFIVSISYLYNINNKLVLISLISIPIQLSITSTVIKFLNDSLEKKREINFKLLNFCRDKLTNLKLTKSFNIENTIICKFNLILNHYMNKILTICKVNSILKIFNSLVEMMPFILTFSFGGYFVIQGEMNFGQLMIFNSLLDNVVTPLKVIPTIPRMYLSAKISYKKLKQVINTSIPIKDSLNSDDFVNVSRNSLVLFENVKFKSSENTILENINFEIKKGETVLLAGKSGSGKSTLIDLICGFEDPTSGTILFEGENINNLDKDILRKDISLVNQNPNLFPWSIKENITSGKDYSDKKILDISKYIKSHNFIELKQNSYETILNENSECLSGGEKQKIAIARAMIKQSKILILDEPTSALDKVSEEALLDVITADKDNTILIVTHKPECLKSVDKVLILKNKKIEQINKVKDFLIDPYSFY